jgi:hypothetical protein
MSSLFCAFRPEILSRQLGTNATETISKAMKHIKEYEEANMAELCSLDVIHKNEQVEVYNPREKVLTSLKINSHVLARNKHASSPKEAFKGTCVEDVFTQRPFTSGNRMYAKYGSRRVRVDWFVCCQVKPEMEFHCFQIRSTPHPLDYEKDFHFPTLQFCETLYDCCDFLNLSQLDTMNNVLAYFEEKRYPQLQHVELEIATKLTTLIDEILMHCDLPDWDFLFDKKSLLQKN